MGNAYWSACNCMYIRGLKGKLNKPLSLCGKVLVESVIFSMFGEGKKDFEYFFVWENVSLKVWFFRMFVEGKKGLGVGKINTQYSFKTSFFVWENVSLKYVFLVCLGKEKKDFEYGNECPILVQDLFLCLGKW